MRSNRSFCEHCQHHCENICEICSHKFSTAKELYVPRQQGCEGLIEIESNVKDCKPTVVDFTNSECYIQTDENNQAPENDSNVIVEQSTYSNRVTDRLEQQRAADENKIGNMVTRRIIGKKPLQKKNRDDKIRRSNETASNKQYPCEFCDRIYGCKSSLMRHLHVHQDKRPIRCALCNKS